MKNLRDGILDLPLARTALNRDAANRNNAQLVTDLRNSAATLVLPVWDSKVLVDEASLRLLSPLVVAEASVWAYLGETSQGQVLLAVLNEQEALRVAPASEWVSLRKAGNGLSDQDTGIFVTGLALANWHATHKHCSKCGSQTIVTQSGWVRYCEADSLELFPRTDPAVIVAITDADDRLLLGSQGVWEDGRWSILAGFVEAGESLGEAVAREMYEEAGVKVSDLKFLGSQAWPFPRSLMFGFSARVEDASTLRPDGEEIVRLRFFSREELLASLSEIILPGRITISRAMIEHWLGQSVACKGE